MPDILSYASAHKPQSGRPLPEWVWFLALLVPPVGPFLALAGARLLSWPKAILLAILSYGTIVGTMVLLLGWQGPQSFVIPLAVGLVTIFWSVVIYQIGRRADYWSGRTRRTCVILFWFALSLVLMNGLLHIALRFIHPVPPK